MDYGYKEIVYQTINPIQEATASEVQQSTNSGKIPQNSVDSLRIKNRGQVDKSI
jgi:hypothetical protein